MVILFSFAISLVAGQALGGTLAAPSFAVAAAGPGFERELEARVGRPGSTRAILDFARKSGFMVSEVAPSSYVLLDPNGGPFRPYLDRLRTARVALAHQRKGVIEVASLPEADGSVLAGIVHSRGPAAITRSSRYFVHGGLVLTFTHNGQTYRVSSLGTKENGGRFAVGRDRLQGYAIRELNITPNDEARFRSVARQRLWDESLSMRYFGAVVEDTSRFDLALARLVSKVESEHQRKLSQLGADLLRALGAGDVASLVGQEDYQALPEYVRAEVSRNLANMYGDELAKKILSSGTVKVSGSITLYWNTEDRSSSRPGFGMGITFMIFQRP